MSQTTTTNCDICAAAIIRPEKEPAKIQVVFNTEQTEGKYTTPHLYLQNMDICPECLQRLINEHPLIASGAQGYNRYEWRNSKP